jgi:hypothetical protein
MTARELDRAASQLEHMRHQRRARLLMSVAAAALAAAAFVVSNTVAISLICGLACLLMLALVDTIKRRELIERLALNRSAYSVPEVRRYGHRLVVLSGRRRVAAALERVLTNAGAPGSYYLADRVHACRHEISALVEALRAPDTRAEPTSIALCWRLLKSAADSPLYNWRLPAEDLRLAFRRVQAGIRRRPVTSY